MPDWHKRVSRKLEKSKFSAEERTEMSRELGDYLEDLCNDASSDRQHDRAAARKAIAELSEDKNLGANLFRARRECNMGLNDRTKHLWLPVLGMLLTSAALLVAFKFGGLWAYDAYAKAEPSGNFPTLIANIIRHRAVALLIYLGWLYTLPFLAAAGVHWSRRAGSGPIAQIASALSPLLLFSAIFVNQHAAEQYRTSLNFLAMDVLPSPHVFFPFCSSLTSTILTCIVIPGAALLLGVLPSLRKSGIRENGAVASATVA